ncbi:MAG: glycosyltransferase family 2 protein [Candidatus Cloacimonetes bacterium]|nr:glycosyltransferase family 2 protein [Candidatus Cloacimonadota bacterium]
MMKLSAVIITKNEAANILRCLASLSFADEIVVVDSGSEDETMKLCREAGCKVIETEWLGFGNTKRLAVDSASNKWIFSIDADEVVSPELAERIRELLKSEPDSNGYRIKRLSRYLGKIIRHCGWDRDFPLRLFNREHGNFNSKPVHESVQITGKPSKIFEPLHHYTYPTLASHIEKINRYTSISAAEAVRKGKRCSIGAALVRGATKFLKMYVPQKGYLDGYHGFLLSFVSGFGVCLKYLKINTLSRSKEHKQ